jgi:hypothetical protein
MSHEFNPGMICTLGRELLISSERLLTLLSVNVLQQPTVSDVCQHLHKNIKPHRNFVIIYTLFTRYHTLDIQKRLLTATDINSNVML